MNVDVIEALLFFFLKFGVGVILIALEIIYAPHLNPVDALALTLSFMVIFAFSQALADTMDE